MLQENYIKIPIFPSIHESYTAKQHIQYAICSFALQILK